MKFSGNLFKIQTKISVSALILVGSIVGVNAMDEEIPDSLGNASQERLDNTPQRKSKYDTMFSPDSDASNSPLTPHYTTASVVARMPNAGAKNRVVAPQDFKPKSHVNAVGGFAASFKKQVEESPEKFASAVSHEESVEQYNQRIAQIREKFRKRKGKVPTSNIGIQTDYVPVVCELSDVLVNGHTYSSMGDNAVQDFSLTDGVVSSMTLFSPARKQGQYDESADRLTFVEEVYSPVFGQERRHSLRNTTSTSDALVTHGRQLDFSESNSLVSRDVSRIFRSDSALFAGNEDELTIDGVRTSYKDMLSAVDVGKANEYYTYLGYYVDGIELEGDDLRDYCEALLEQDPDSFLEQNVDTIWSYLERKMKEAADYLPGFHKVLIKKDKVKNACIKKTREEVQGVSVLKDEYSVLIQILSGVFNSDSSAMFVDSEEIVGFKSGNWTPATISQGFKFLAAQCIQFHRTNYALTQNISSLTENISLLTRSNAGFEEQIRGYSVRQGELVGVASTNAQTIDRLSREKTELEQRLQVLQQELDGMLPIRAEVAQLKKANAMLTRELTNVKGKPFVSAKLKELV